MPNYAQLATGDVPRLSAPVRSDGRLLALLLATQVPGPLTYTVAMPILAAMATSFAHDPGGAFKVKLVSGILGPAMAVGAPVGGWLAGRFDRRSLLLGLGLLVVLAGVAPALLDDLDGIIATRFLAGLTGAALMTIGYTMIGDYFPVERRSRLFGWLAATSMVASVVSLPLSGWLGDRGWHVPFLIYLIPAVIVVLALRQSLPPPVTSAEAETTNRGWFARLPFGFLLLGFASGFVLSIPGVYFSFHLATLGIRQASSVGLIIMTSSLVSAVASASYGAAVKRAGARRLFIAAFLAMALGLGLFALVRTPLMPVPALAIFGVGMGWVLPNIMATMSQRLNDADRGRGIGILQSVMAIAPLIGLTLLEPLLPRIGTGGVLATMATLSACLALRFVIAP